LEPINCSYGQNGKLALYGAQATKDLLVPGTAALPAISMTGQ